MYIGICLGLAMGSASLLHVMGRTWWDRMATSATIDIENLVAPIPGDSPAGVDLREDDSHDSIYRELKNARKRARDAERQLLAPDPDPSRQPPDPKTEWNFISSNAPKVLLERSKDLEVTAWFIEALVRQHGFPGLRDGLRLARSLVEQYWDNMFPVRDEEDGMLFRVAGIRGLDGGETDGTLILPVRRLALTAAFGEQPPLSLADYVQAQSLEQVQDPDQRAKRIDNGAITLDQFEKSITATDESQLANILDDIDEALEEVILLDQMLEERCDVASDGERTAPPFANIRGVLQECRSTIKMFYHPVEADAVAEEGEGFNGQASTSPGAVAAPSQGMTRDEAFSLLLKVADFFKRTEPHSPLSYSLQQVVRWGRMPLPELLTELIRDDSERERLFTRVGLPLDNNND